MCSSFQIGSTFSRSPTVAMLSWFGSTASHGLREGLRLYNATGATEGATEFEQAARAWLTEILEERRPRVGIAGLQITSSEGDGHVGALRLPMRRDFGGFAARSSARRREIRS